MLNYIYYISLSHIVCGVKCFENFTEISIDKIIIVYNPFLYRNNITSHKTKYNKYIQLDNKWGNKPVNETDEGFLIRRENYIYRGSHQ